MYLFFSEENLYRRTGKREALPEPIFNEPFIGVLNILWKVAEKGKGGVGCRQLSHVFYLYMLALE
jgi:hypothetical protein